jgi:hypothetical protein
MKRHGSLGLNRKLRAALIAVAWYGTAKPVPFVKRAASKGGAVLIEFSVAGRESPSGKSHAARAGLAAFADS